MNIVSAAGGPLAGLSGVLLVLTGLALCWRGVWGGRQGERGLLRRRAATLGRIEGWRLTILGLALAGIGAAWLGDTPGLLFLSLGIGVVEVLEASFVIAAWKRDGWRGDDRAAHRRGERVAAHRRR